MLILLQMDSLIVAPALLPIFMQTNNSDFQTSFSSHFPCWKPCIATVANLTRWNIKIFKLLHSGFSSSLHQNCPNQWLSYIYIAQSSENFSVFILYDFSTPVSIAWSFSQWNTFLSFSGILDSAILSASIYSIPPSPLPEALPLHSIYILGFLRAWSG